MPKYAEDSDIPVQSSAFRKILGVIVLCFVTAFILTLGRVIEVVDAGSVVIIQSAFDGSLKFYSSPGPKLQFYGDATTYHLRGTINFGGDGSPFPPIKVVMNDGADETVSGAISYELSGDQERAFETHRRYRSQEAVESMIYAAFSAAARSSGSMLSSTEIYQDRRNDFLRYVMDQVQNGVYETVSETIEIAGTNVIAGNAIARRAKILEKDGIPVRLEESSVKTFGMRVFNPSISVEPSENVKAQIQKVQEQLADTQLAVIEARKAQQQKITAQEKALAEAAIKVGEVNAIQQAEKAKADGLLQVEIVSAQKQLTNAVMEAARKLEVARLAKQEAELFTQTEQLRGEGEAARKKAALEADGNLDKRLEAWVTVNTTWAKALGEYRGHVVPSVVLGNDSGSKTAGGNGIEQLMQLIGAKTARDLALDITSTNAFSSVK